MLNTGIYASAYTVDAEIELAEKPELGGGFMLHMPNRSRKSGAFMARLIKGGQGIFWGTYDESGAFRGRGFAELTPSENGIYQLKLTVRGNRLDVAVGDKQVAPMSSCPPEGWLSLVRVRRTGNIQKREDRCGAGTMIGLKQGQRLIAALWARGRSVAATWAHGTAPFDWLLYPALIFAAAPRGLRGGILGDVFLPTEAGHWVADPNSPFLSLWAKWDSQWYIQIVREGYLFQPLSKATWHSSRCTRCRAPADAAVRRQSDPGRLPGQQPGLLRRADPPVQTRRAGAGKP